MTRDEAHLVILSLPQVDEGLSHGRPCYKAFGKFLTRLWEEEAVIVLGGVPSDERDMLCAADPATFFVTDHYRNYPYVLGRLAGLEPEQLRGFVTRQWRKSAPRKWLRAYDAGTG